MKRTSLSLFFFGCWKDTLGGDGRALWSLVDFWKSWWALRRISYDWFSAGWHVRTNVTLSLIFLSYIWNETVLSTNFILSICEWIWSSLCPRFTNHCFNCCRRIIIFSHIEKILLGLATYQYAIDSFYGDMIVHEGTGAYQLI